MTTRVVIAGSHYVTAVSTDDCATWVYGTLPTVAAVPPDNYTDWAIANNGALVVAIPMYTWPAVITLDVAAHSADGLSWVPVALPLAQRWSAPVWTGTKFVTIGQTHAAHSIDGQSWVGVALGFTLDYTDNDGRPLIGHVGENLVAYGRDSTVPTSAFSTTATSSDGGLTWTLQAPANLGSRVRRCLSRAADVLVTYDAEPLRTLVTFPYSVTNEIAPEEERNWVGQVLAIGPSMVAALNAETSSRSLATTGMPSWTHQAAGIQVSPLNDMAWTGTKFIAVGPDYNGDLLVDPSTTKHHVQSVDGLTWSLLPLAKPPANTADWQDWNSITVQQVAPATVFEAGISDTISLSDIYGTGAQQIFAAIVSTLQLAMQVSGVAGFSAAIMDRLVVFSDGSAAYPVSASMVDALMIADGGTRGVYDLHDAINNPAQFSIDSMTGAVSIYDGYDFSSYARVGQGLYGCRADGVYRIGGNSDSGATINAGLDLGATTLGSPMGKTIGAVYMGVDTDGTVYMRAHAADSEHTYRLIKQGPVLRAILAKGVAARTWGLKFNIEGASFANLDLIEIEAGVHSRRMKR